MSDVFTLLTCPSCPSRCAGGRVRPLLGSLSRGPHVVAVHGPLLLRARPHHLWGVLLPELRHQPHPLQPHVHQVQGNVQPHHLLLQEGVDALQPQDDTTQHFK